MAALPLCVTSATAPPLGRPRVSPATSPTSFLSSSCMSHWVLEFTPPCFTVAPSTAIGAAVTQPFEVRFVDDIVVGNLVSSLFWSNMCVWEDETWLFCVIMSLTENEEWWRRSWMPRDPFGFERVSLKFVSLWFGLYFYFAQVEEDSEDDGERNEGWRTMVWICYVGFVQVQNESDNWGIGRRWICWVNQGATMGYGVLVGILRMKVWFFCFVENTIRKSTHEWRRWNPK